MPRTPWSGWTAFLVDNEDSYLNSDQETARDARVALIIRFRKRHQRKNAQPWRGVRRRHKQGIFRRMRRWELLLTFVVVAAMGGVELFGGDGISTSTSGHGGGNVISCYSPGVIDGDTFTCSGRRIRLASIDAPEMPGHCKQGRKCTQGDPYASRDYLRSLASGSVTCRSIETDHYGRTVALCEAGGKDLSCAMVGAGHAVKRYGSLSCFK